MARSVSPGLADSVARLGTETAFDVLALAKSLEREGRDIVHLEIGEPDFPTPSHICDAAVRALQKGHTRYSAAEGLPELREAAAAFLTSTRCERFDPERVVVGTGAKPFLFFTVLATCNPGDEVIYPDPGFPIYESAIRWAGATPVPLPLLEEADFAFDLNLLAKLLSPRTKLVILNSPHNPTGGVLDAANLEVTAALIQETNAWVLSDEIYSQIVYDDPFASIATVPGMLDRTVVLDGMSKAFAMTGWRCGFAHLPPPLVDPIVRFFVNSTSCVPPFVQIAAVAALSGPHDTISAMVAEFRVRRDLIVSGLNALPGVSCRMPQGAFYAFPNVRDVGVPARELASRLLAEAGVAVLAGAGFGRVGTDNLRLSYANSQDNLRRALERTHDLLATSTFP